MNRRHKARTMSDLYRKRETSRNHFEEGPAPFFQVPPERGRPRSNRGGIPLGVWFLIGAGWGALLSMALWWFRPM